MVLKEVEYTAYTGQFQLKTHANLKKINKKNADYKNGFYDFEG